MELDQNMLNVSKSCQTYIKQFIERSSWADQRKKEANITKTIQPNWER